MKRKTTSIKVDPEFWKQVKSYTALKGIDISDLLEDLLKKELEKEKKKQ
ncbi:MAG: hypothetical protein Q7R70_01435 [Candidatus Diapherotrites archaeon]|nr:hypothetical protein [Candidatus Diapherotrites archaeon]